MSRERIVRKPLSASRRASRSFDERLIVRFPWLFRAVGRLVFRLPPKSRLRQAVIWRSISQGFGAVNRRDFAAVLQRYRPDVEIRLAPEFQALDLESVYRGREGYLQIYREYLPAFGDGFRLEPRELIDLGDGRFVGLAEIDLRGERSGVELGQRIAYLWMVDDDGTVVVEEQFSDWDRALQAVGLSQQELSKHAT